MSQLMVSYYIESTRGKPYGQRVWDDGQVESYMVSQRARRADGSFYNEPLTPGWYVIARLDESQRQALQQAVRDAGLAALPEVIDDAGTDSTAGKRAEWQVTTPDGLKTIAITNWPPAGPMQDDLLTLTERINDLIHAAQVKSAG